MYGCRYTLVKHELDLRRLYPETRAAAERAEHGTTTTDDDDEKAGGGGKPEDGRGSRGLGAGAAAGGGGADSVKRTLLMRHKMRPLRCRNCRAFYIEDQNQGTACAFHPGELAAEPGTRRQESQLRSEERWCGRVCR